MHKVVVYACLLTSLPWIQCSQCPQGCFCVRVVHCGKLGLTQVPDSLPLTTDQLKLDGNPLKVIERANLSALSQLHHLYLSDCQIHSIQVGSFADLQDLEWLDLSNNNLHYLEARTFHGLLRLKQLFLFGNRGLSFHPQVFVDMRTTGLYMYDCSIEEIQPAVLEPLHGHLETLLLHSNSLVSVSRDLQPVFSALQHLTLGQNPWHCNCQLEWLRTLYINTSASIFSNSDAPACLSPPGVRGRTLDQVQSIVCVAPTLTAVDMVIEANHTLLQCSAVGDPAPSIVWVTPSGAQQYVSPGTSGTTAIIYLSSQPRGQFFCVAANDAGSRTFTFNLTWPVLSYSNMTTGRTQPPSTPISPAVSSQRDMSRTTTTTTSSNSLVASASVDTGYSLAQLIVAVLCTIFVTLLLVVVTTWICWSRVHTRKEPTQIADYIYQPAPQPSVDYRNYLIDPPTLPKR